MLLEDLRAQVVLAAQTAQRTGLCKHKSGNVSAFDPETGYICVTPTGIDRELLQPRDICVIDRALNVIEGGTPSSETPMHIACYAARPGIRAIVHTHSHYATSFAIVNRAIPAIVAEMSSFRLENARIPVAPFAPPGTKQLAENVAEKVKNADLVLMERHGAVAVGNTPDDALLAASYIEEIAELYLHALHIGNGKEPPAFTQAEFDSWG